ncbi:MAG TPA: hypothetical protein EYQ24_00005 [Bacteroidetes bacterium]|nr:hypothetical protein [Bacteroidota bacterium]
MVRLPRFRAGPAPAALAAGHDALAPGPEPGGRFVLRAPSREELERVAAAGVQQDEVHGPARAVVVHESGEVGRPRALRSARFREGVQPLEERPGRAV